MKKKESLNEYMNESPNKMEVKHWKKKKGRFGKSCGLFTLLGNVLNTSNRNRCCMTSLLNNVQFRFSINSLSLHFSFRSCCLVIQRLKAASSSALMKALPTRSTVWTSISKACSSTPSRRSGSWPTVWIKRWAIGFMFQWFLTQVLKAIVSWTAHFQRWWRNYGVPFCSRLAGLNELKTHPVTPKQAC